MVCQRRQPPLTMTPETLIYARQGPPPMPLGANPNSTESRVAQLYGFMGAFVPLAFIVLLLRLYSRWRFTGIGKDDVLVSITFILYVGLVVATVFAAKFGLGTHIWTVSEASGILMQKARRSSATTRSSPLTARSAASPRRSCTRRPL